MATPRPEELPASGAEDEAIAAIEGISVDAASGVNDFAGLTFVGQTLVCRVVKESCGIADWSFGDLRSLRLQRARNETMDRSLVSTHEQPSAS